MMDQCDVGLHLLYRFIFLVKQKIFLDAGLFFLNTENRVCSVLCGRGGA